MFLITTLTARCRLPSRRFYLDYLHLLFVHSESGLPIAGDVLKVPMPRVLARLAKALVSERVAAPEEQGLNLMETEKYFVGLELRYEHADSVPVAVATSASDRTSEEKEEKTKEEKHLPIVKEIYNGEEVTQSEEP